MNDTTKIKMIIKTKVEWILESSMHCIKEWLCNEEWKRWNRVEGKDSEMERR